MLSLSPFVARMLPAIGFSLVVLGTMHPATAQEAARSPASAQPSTSAATADPDKARLRVFGQNAVLVEFYENSTCVGGDKPKTRVSGGVGDAFSSFFGRSTNTSIGMKETSTTQNLAKRDGMMSKAYFREYAVAGKQPLAVRMHVQNTGISSCGDIGGMFTPEPGKDYEVRLDMEAQQCKTVVKEIVQDEQGVVSLQDVPLAQTVKCP